MMRRVVVTGVGVVSSIGCTAADFWASLSSGSPGIRPLAGDFHGQQLRLRCAAQVSLDLAQHFEPKQAAYLDRFAQLGMVAAREALRDSALELTPELAEQTAIATGSSLGGKQIEDDGYVQLYAKSAQRLHPFTITRSMHNALTSQLAMETGVTGPAWTVSTACSSANHAIGQAFWMVRSGSAECALVGGAEMPFTLGLLRAWEAMRVLAPDTCRPFSAERKGLVLGEGAAMLVLEPLERAQARGATIYAELAGFGMSADAHHFTMPSPAGGARAMRAALRDATLAPEQIDYVNAHGTGTVANDAAETRALREVFGTHADKLAASSTKSMHGHTLGAAGALEAVATVLALRHGLLPPTCNSLGRDPECDLDY
ncbi:MAG: beta-ketoacyl-[acyl-carrier-protein] synthase family protein, partial [Acidobacteria bacterium]|nr:beta-ketoacyl-[acyl-carrier-protein] synthase family protein [Acidobacteriota bacterium]